MSNIEQSVTLLRKNKMAQVAALSDIGFSDVTVATRASEFAKYIKWSAGLLDITVAAVHKTTGEKFYFTIPEWTEQLTETNKAKLLVRGLRIRANKLSFIMSFIAQSSLQWSTTATDITAQPDTSGKAGLWDATNALELTKTIYNHWSDGDVHAPAANVTRFYKAFTQDIDGRDDTTEWCLPCVAHLMVMYKHKTAIDAAIMAVKGDAAFKLNKDIHWTCQEYNTGAAWQVDLANGLTYTATKTAISATRYVRPIALD